MDVRITDRRELIEKYYTNLEYCINKNEALHKIRDLTSKLQIQEPNNFANRLRDTATIIQDNFCHFVSICEHKDMVTGIIDYLKHFSVQTNLTIHEMKGEFTDKEEIMETLMLTIYNINLEPEMQLFLEKALIKNSIAGQVTDDSYKTEILKQKVEMILLEESDLYAVIYYLKIKNALSLKKIWVQESIKQTFRWHVKKYLRNLNIPICIFQSKEELLMSEDFSIELRIYEIRILSIWSEDIVGARNLAMSFKSHIIFINTHMNFCAGILLPYLKLFYSYLNFSEDETKDINAKYVIKENKQKKDESYYNLFYNGMWQKPEKNMYYTLNDDIFIAQASSEDVKKCITSAVDGFRIWSTMSINNRMQILSRLASILECQGELDLANVVSKWLKLPYYCINQLTRHETEQFEVTNIREPRGVIILEETNTITMFRNLTQSLITGNSIIVICNPDMCVLTFYCDMFSTATIPPGVINLLSSNNLTNIRYNNLADLKPEEAYAYLTTSKHIVICLK